MIVVVANSNPVHIHIEQMCKELLGAFLIKDKSELNFEKLSEIKPDYIFFLHWSFIIPKEVFENFNCILFHMTDLPYGRGGSPLQNLILQGKTETMISAIKVEAGIDTGPIFLKKQLSLIGTAEEIFLRAGKTMFAMMKEMMKTPLSPIKQEGEGTNFKRRTPEESNVQNIENLETLYDFIRMLDSEGYPKAFIETKCFKFEFSRASFRRDGIFADVKIIKK